MLADVRQTVEEAEELSEAAGFGGTVGGYGRRIRKYGRDKVDGRSLR